MPVHVLSFLAALGGRFIRAAEGSVLSTFTLALVPIMATVGAAVDYSRASNLRAQMQSILDAAVIAGARDGTANWMNVATNFFNANLQSMGASVSTPTFVHNADGTFSGSVAAGVATTVLGMMGKSSIAVNVQTQVAVSNARAGQFCLLALNTTAPSAVQLTGNAEIDVDAPQCVVQVNSNSASAVMLNGNTSISSSENCFVGSAVTVGNATLSPPPVFMCKPVTDPLASFLKPSVGPCDYVNYSASGHQTVTLNPGVYCGGMQFTGQVTVTFAPGTYVIKDGALQARGGTSFTGNGVAFFLTGSGASVQLTGQADWHVVAPASGTFAGFVFFLDPNGPSGAAASSSQLAGTAELYFEGVIYLPKQNVTLSGGSESFTPSPYTAYIMDTMDINGNGTLVINSDPTKTTVPIPAALLLSIGAQPRLVQ
jgi:Flp pilus assembly protein TadG